MLVGVIVTVAVINPGVAVSVNVGVELIEAIGEEVMLIDGGNTIGVEVPDVMGMSVFCLARSC